MKLDNWKYNDIWGKWENMDRFEGIYIDKTPSDGVTRVIADCRDGRLYNLAIFSSKKEAEEWLNKFMS